MTRRRRAFLLVEMLTVMFMLAIGGTLMVVGLASIHRSHKRVAEFGNRYALLNDFLRCLSRDVRMAKTATVGDGEGEELRQTLVIGRMPERVLYRFYKGHVERAGFKGDSVAAKRWEPMSAAVKITGSRAVAGETIVSVTVSWPRTDKKDPEPNRRFDVAMRCNGELGNDGD
ncbi:MAG: type II secretion system protein [Planctomycetota bacterium]|jgi:hypothetical protein